MIKSSHRVQIFKKKRLRPPFSTRSHPDDRPWVMMCSCSYTSTWRFWRNAMGRAEMHIMYPGVYR